MILEVSDWSSKSVHKSDVLVIGSGAAGTSIALGLQKLGVSIIVTEGGGRLYTEKSQECYEGESSGIELPYGLKGSRLRFYGGSTNCWGGMCGELNEDDFKKRDWIPDSGWPINKGDLLPYYKKAAEFLGINYSSVKNPEEVDKFKRFNGLESQSLVHTKKQNFQNVFQSKFKNEKNMDLFLNANFLNFSRVSSADKVDYIEIGSFNGKKSKIHAKFFVLACGGIENPRILLNSAEVGRSAFGSVHDNLGRYFCDHPIAPCATVIDLKGKSKNFPYNESKNYINDGKSLVIPYYRIPSSVQHKYGLLNSTLKFQEQEDEISSSAFYAWRLKNLITGKGDHKFHVKNLVDIASDPYGILKGIISKNSSNSGEGGKRIAMRFQIEQAPLRSNKVSLVSDKDSLGLNRVKLHWGFSELEIKTVETSVSYVASLMNYRKKSTLMLDKHLLERPSKLPIDLRGGQHHSGTTRMSIDQKTGVVDKDLKVHGTQNLFVCGSSVFPTNGWVNPTFTIIALGLRLSEHLARVIQK